MLERYRAGKTSSILGHPSRHRTAGALPKSFLTGSALVAALPTRPTVFALCVELIGNGLLMAVTPDRAALGPGRHGSGARGAILWTVVTPGPCERGRAHVGVGVEADDIDDSQHVLRRDALRRAYVDPDDPTHLKFA